MDTLFLRKNFRCILSKKECYRSPDSKISDFISAEEAHETLRRWGRPFAEAKEQHIIAAMTRPRIPFHGRVIAVTTVFLFRLCEKKLSAPQCLVCLLCAYKIRNFSLKKLRQEATCGLFQKAMEHRKSRRAFWEKMKALFCNFLVESWQDLFTAIGPGFKGARLVINTC